MFAGVVYVLQRAFFMGQLPLQFGDLGFQIVSHHPQVFAHFNLLF
jgi:hypothetical protein